MNVLSQLPLISEYQEEGMAMLDGAQAQGTGSAPMSLHDSLQHLSQTNDGIYFCDVLLEWGMDLVLLFLLRKLDDEKSLKTAREWLSSSLTKDHISGRIRSHLINHDFYKNQSWWMSVVSVWSHLGGINCIRDGFLLWSTKRLAGLSLWDCAQDPRSQILLSRFSVQGGPDDGFGLENVTIIYLHHNVYNGVCVFVKECWKGVHAIRHDLCQLHSGSGLLLSHLKTRLGISSQ